MPARSEWKGFLQINQLQVPVKAFSAASSEPEITLNQLHRDCGDRIRQQRFCPQHGPVESEDIIHGYRVAENCYLPIEPAELDRLKPESDKTIAVDCFVNHDAIDPIYYTGRTLYLVPDGPPGQRPFNVLREGLRTSGRHAFSRVVMARREQLVLLRPVGQLLAMNVIEYSHRVRSSADYESEVLHQPPSVRELDLIRQLIEALTDHRFDLSRYRNCYLDDLSALIEQRIAAADLVSASSNPAVREHEEASDAAMVALLEASLLAAGVPETGTRMRDASSSSYLDDEANRKLA